MFHGRLSFLVVQAICLPCDIVVSIHHSSDGVEDEEQQEEQPIRQVMDGVSLHVCLDEGGQTDDGLNLAGCQF